MRAIAVIAVWLSIFYCCGESPVSGGSSDHGNARIGGVVADRFGDPVSNAIIELIPGDYNHLSDSTRALTYTTITDSNGCYNFDSVCIGNYTISGRSEYNEIGFTLRSVYVDSSTYTGVITADAFGSIFLETDSLKLPDGCAIFFPGLKKYIYVEKQYRVVVSQIPKGVIQLKGFNPESGKTIDLGKEYLSIEIIPGKTLILPSRSPKPFCLQNDSIILCPQGKVNDTFTMSIIDPSLGIEGNWSFRISWGDGNISDWTNEDRILHIWNRKGIYPVQSQVLFQGQYLAWSDPVFVEIIDR